MHPTLTLLLLLPTMAFALALPAQPSSTTEVQQYAQCGGTNYSGATTCASGLMCKAWNPYYSQCIPTEEDPAQQAQAQSCSTTTPTTTTNGQTGTTGQSSTPSQESSPSQSSTPSQGSSSSSSQNQNSSPSQNTTPSQTSTPTSSAAPETSGAAGSSTGEKMYTVDTFIQFLEEKAGDETASMMKRLIGELMMD